MLARATMLAFAVLVLTIVSNEAVDAAAVNRPYTVTITVTEQDQLQREWIDDGVLHIRGQRFVDAVTGDLTGTQVSIANIDLNVITGEGTGSASFELDTDHGSWSGHFSGQIHSYAFSGRIEGNGTGDWKGTQILGSFMQTGDQPETFVEHGRILTTSA